MTNQIGNIEYVGSVEGEDTSEAIWRSSVWKPVHLANGLLDVVSLGMPADLGQDQLRELVDWREENVENIDGILRIGEEVVAGVLSMWPEIRDSYFATAAAIPIEFNGHTDEFEAIKLEIRREDTAA